MLTLWLAAVAIVLFSSFILLLLKRSTYYWKAKGVAQPPSLPLFGNYLPVLLLKTNPPDFYYQLYNEFPEERMVGFYEFTNPTLLVKDPELVEQVLVRDFTIFPDHGSFIFESTSVLYDAVFMMQGERWRALRNKLLSTFATGRMRVMFQGILDCCQELLARRPDRLDRHAISHFAVDSFLRALFGAKLELAGEEEFRHSIRSMFEPPVTRYMQQQFLTYYPKLGNLLNMKYIPQYMDDYFRSVITAILNTRERQGLQRKDFTDLLLQLRKTGVLNVFSRSNFKTDKTFEMTEELLISQGFFFFFAGMDTTSLVMLYTGLELACHPDVQEKARAEVRRLVSKHDGITYNAVREMKYIEQCIQEALRLHPSLPFIMRVAERTTTLGGVEVEKGTRIIIPNHALQMDPKHWNEPESYLPERFAEGAQWNKFAHLPFSDGPRICAGKKFSTIEITTLFAHLLLKYELSVDPETELPLKYQLKTLFLTPEHPVVIRLTELQQSPEKEA